MVKELEMANKIFESQDKILSQSPFNKKKILELRGELKHIMTSIYGGWTDEFEKANQIPPQVILNSLNI